jgi:putative nucleotidyltransferase-like protein
MTAFVHSALQHAGEMSANARTAIRAEARMQAARALRASAELGAIVQSLIDAGINSVALKGPAFSEWLYNSSACRAFTDLDILVAPHEFAAAVRTLGALGYRLPPGISPAAARVVYACRGAWPLERPASFKIDLHWRTADRRFAEPFDAGAICRDATSFLVGGATVRIPSATHAAAVSFVHAAKHAWCGLEVLLSLAMLMRRTDVDWDRLMRAARRSGSVTAVVAGARLASELFDVPGYHALAMPTGTFPSRAAERDVHRRCLDRAGLRVRYDFLRVVMPTPAEAEVCRLPDPLTPLYAPLRIARVAALGIPAVLRSQSS